MVTFEKSAQARLHTSMGELVFELLLDKAPRTCENFARLAHQGFYDGLTFHRVLDDFMVQGGCPKGDGTGGPGYTIRPEFNDTPHVRGTVSMARGNDPHSAGSQFFVCTHDARYLDYKYSAFAKLVDGDDVLEKIATVPVEENRFKECSTPRFPVYINRVEIDGAEFDDSDMPGGGGRAAPARERDAAQAEDDGQGGQAGQGGGRGGRGGSKPQDEPEAAADEPVEEEAPKKKATRKKASSKSSSGGKSGAKSTRGTAKAGASKSGAKKATAKKTTTKKKAAAKRAKKD